LYFASSIKKKRTMNDLIEIYRRIEYLRNNGLKMKEIADYVDMAPSVLSALYSSVLPTYVTSLKQGHSEEGFIRFGFG
jgi:DNA-binding transcriptional MerR regulator